MGLRKNKAVENLTILAWQSPSIGHWDQWVRGERRRRGVIDFAPPPSPPHAGSGRGRLRVVFTLRVEDAFVVHANCVEACSALRCALRWVMTPREVDLWVHGRREDGRKEGGIEVLGVT